MIVKPARSGSALGCTKVDARRASCPSAMVGAYAYGDLAVIEEFIEGTEVAVTVVELDGERGARCRRSRSARTRASTTTPPATPPVRPGSSCPASVSDEVAAACAELAVAAHRVLGLRDLSRIDIIVRPDGTPVFLETNVAPGMTETSLVPLAVEAAGYDFGLLCAQLVDNAWARHLS